MDEMVFKESEHMDTIPFTTSKVIAECAGVKHHAVQQLCVKYKADLEEFGVVAFEMRKPPAGSLGGRPEVIYHLNEEQATLLITYLQNTPQVRAFKKELVRQFYAMKAELTRRKIEKAKLTPVRRSMTDAIRDNIPDTPGKKFCYKNYTDLAYKTAFGKTAAQLRKERGAAKDSVATDYLTEPELSALETVMGRIEALIALQFSYPEIKSALARRLVAGKGV